MQANGRNKFHEKSCMILSTNSTFQKNCFKVLTVLKIRFGMLNERIVDENLRHLADSSTWKLIDLKWPDFGYEPRNIRLALPIDGINQHDERSFKYSSWFVVIVATWSLRGAADLPVYLILINSFGVATNHIRVWLVTQKKKKKWSAYIQGFKFGSQLCVGKVLAPYNTQKMVTQFYLLN